MRDELMKSYSESLTHLQYKIKVGRDAKAHAEAVQLNRLYRGITRFLFEDSHHAQQTKSRTSLQKTARIKAYEVIRRSQAWSHLIAERFPEALRLSIHPHRCGEPKLGIQLIHDEVWMTPWHGVIVKSPIGYRLLKRKTAELLGAQLITFEDGRPSHYQLDHPIEIQTMDISHAD